MKFFQRKPQPKSMNVNHYDLYYTVRILIDQENEKCEISNKLFQAFFPL